MLDSRLRPCQVRTQRSPNEGGHDWQQPIGLLVIELKKMECIFVCLFTNITVGGSACIADKGRGKSQIAAFTQYVIHSCLINSPDIDEAHAEADRDFYRKNQYAKTGRQRQKE